MKLIKKLKLFLDHISLVDNKISIDCDVDMNYRNIKNVCNPIDHGDATSRFYVDASWDEVIWMAQYGISTFHEIDGHIWRHGLIMVEKDDVYYHLSKIEYSEGAPSKYHFFNGNTTVTIDKNDQWETLNYCISTC